MTLRRASICILGLLFLAGCTETKRQLTDLGQSLDRFFGVDHSKSGSGSGTSVSAEPYAYRAALAKKRKGDHAAAASLFRQAAEEGHGGAAYELGLAYAKGRGVKRDLDRSATWINRAAARGEPRGQYLLGASYFAGNGVPQDYARAAENLAAAATQGHARAQYLLAKSFADGLGVPKDPAWAARWYGKAARQGHIEAQYAYGVVWAAGLGRPQNIERGYFWLSIAAEGEHPEAERVRSNLASRLEENYRDRAEAAAKAFRASSAKGFADEPTVSYAQYSLNLLGYGAGDVDGIEGRKTRDALRRFQKAQKLTPDGRLGPKSLTKLVVETRKHSPSVEGDPAQ